MVIRWHIFGLFAVFAPIMFSKGLDACFAKRTLSSEQKKKIRDTKIRYTCLYWLIDLFYMSIFNDLFWWRYVFGGILVVIGYSGIASVLIGETKSLKRLLPYELIVDTGILVYLIHSIPVDSLRTIIAGMVNSLCGGIITLIGVSWTIRHTQSERKLNERNAIKPIIYSISNVVNYDSTNQCDVVFIVDQENAQRVFLGIIQNSDNGILIFKEAIINNKQCLMEQQVVLNKNVPAQIILMTNEGTQINSFVLVGSDVQGNEIKYQLLLRSKESGGYCIESVVEIENEQL